MTLPYDVSLRLLATFPCGLRRFDWRRRRLSDTPRGGPAGDAAGENAAAEEGTFKRRITVETTTAEAGHLACRVQSRHGLSVGTNDAAVEIGLQAAERFPRQDMQPNRNQRSGGRIEELVRTHRPRQFVAEIAPRGADGGDLHILAICVIELAIARGDFALDGRGIEQWRAAGKRIHALDQPRQIRLDDEILALVHECLDRPRNARPGAGDDLAPALAGEIGVLLGARQREFLLDDLSRQDEPGIVVSGLADIFECRERIEPGIKRDRQTLAARVEPERGRPGNDANGVVAPDRIPVLDPFDIVPHPVAVDDGSAGGLADRQHAAVNIVGYPGDHPLRRRPKALRPISAHQVVIAADAARGDDDSLGFEFERRDDVARAFPATLDVARSKNVASYPVDRAARFH